MAVALKSSGGRGRSVPTLWRHQRSGRRAWLRKPPSELSLVDIRRAAERIAGEAVRTPLLESAALADRLGGRIFLKCENLQRTGSFKFRGAYNALAALSSDD